MRKAFFAVALLVGLAFLLSASSARAVNPDVETPAVSDGLQRTLRSFAESARSLRDFAWLSESPPLTDLDPMSENVLALRETFVGFADQMAALMNGGGAPTNLADLASRLEQFQLEPAPPGPIVATHAYLGCASGASATCGVTQVTSGAARGLRVPVNVVFERDIPPTGSFGPIELAGGVIRPKVMLSGVITLVADGGLLALPPLEREAAAPVYAPAGQLPTLDFLAEINSDDLHLDGRIGLGSLDIGGTAHLLTRMTLAVTDPDPDGRLTLAELTTTAPTDLFAATRAGSGTVTFSVDSPLTDASPDAEIPFTYDSATNELNVAEAPDITTRVASLLPLTNMTMPELFGSLANLVGAISAAQNAGIGDAPLPFTNQRVRDVVDVDELLREALVAAGILERSDDGTASTVAVDASRENLATLSTVEKVLTALAAQILGPGRDFRDFGAELVDGQLTFRITRTRSLTRALDADLGALSGAGLSAFAQTPGDNPPLMARVTVSPTVTTDFDLGLDLVDGRVDPRSRLYLTTGAGNQIEADFPIDLNLDAQARIGFLDVVVKDANNSGPVRILERRDSRPMLRIGFASPDNRLTVAEMQTAVLGDGVNTDPNPGGNTGTPNTLFARVPSTPITVSVHPDIDYARASTDPEDVDVPSANIRVAWGDVTQTEPTHPDGPKLSFEPGNTRFQDLFLPFAFDPENPQALFGHLHGAIDRLATELSAALRAAPALQGRMPLVGGSVGELVSGAITFADDASALLADGPPSALAFIQAFETRFGGSLSLSLPTGSPVHPEFRWRKSIRDAFDVPLNLALGGDGAGLTSSSGARIDYTLGIEVGFGADLPAIALGAFGDSPAAAAVNGVYVLDTSRITIGLAAEINGVVEANLLGYKVRLGGEDGFSGRVPARLELSNTEFVPGEGERVPLAQVPAFVASLLPDTLDIRPVRNSGKVLPGQRSDCDDSDGDGAPDDGCGGGELVLVRPGGATEGIGALGFSVPDVSDPTIILSGFDGVLEHLADKLISWSTLVDGLDRLALVVQNSLRSGADDAEVPFFKDGLDAGADVLGQLRDGVILPLRPLAEVLDRADNAAEIQQQLTAALAPAGVTVELGCDELSPGDMEGAPPHEPGDCTTSHAPTSIQFAEAKFTFTGQATQGLPFDLGLPGFEISSAADAGPSAAVTWDLNLTFGLARGKGFYVLDGSGLTLSAGINIGGFDGALAFVPFHAEDMHPGLDGSVSATLAFDGGGPDGRIFGDNLTGAGLDLDVAVPINVQLALTVGGDSADLPALPRFTANLAFEWDLPGGQPPSLRLGGVKVDVGSFLGSVLEPVLEGVAAATEPIRPVIDFVTAPIPLLADVAELVPGMRAPTVLESLAGDNKLISTVIAIIDMANNFRDGGSGGIPIGSFDIDLAEARYEGAADRIQQRLLANASAPDGPQFLQTLLDSDGTGQLDRSRTQAGFTFPAFDDPTQLFGFLIGGNPTLVRWDAGPLDATVAARLSVSIPGVPISIDLGATGGAQGHLAIGLDTAGIRRALERGVDDFGDVLGIIGHGLYIDDYDGTADPDELRFFFEVTGGAGVDAVIVEAKIEGGMKGELGFDLRDDQPEDPGYPDGKVRFEEVANLITTRPGCLFNIHGSLEGFLRLVVEIDFFFDEVRWEKILARYPVLSAATIKPADCTSPPRPDLADVVGDTLVLHAGDVGGGYYRGKTEHHPDLETYPEPVDERLVVRRLRDGRVSVEGIGITEVFPNHDDPGGPITKVVGYGGEGNDAILALPSGDTADPESMVPFTIPVEFCGGPGDDTIGGGTAGDTLLGDGFVRESSTVPACLAAPGPGGVDVLTGGDGADTLRGGNGNDTLDAGLGADSAYGDDGNDNVTGGPGTDVELRGGEGDDTITAGLDDENAAAPIALIFGDGGIDRLEGSANRDRLDGGPGNDVLIGMEGDDELSGGPDQDDLRGFAGTDTLRGDAGDDKADGGPGRDTIDGGPGNDLGLIGGDGSDIVSGGPDTDMLIGGLDDTDPNTGQRGDVLRGDGGQDLLIGDIGTGRAVYLQRLQPQGDDICPAPNAPDPDCSPPPPTGVLEISPDVELETGAGGNDDLFGGDEGDFLFGGPGADNVFGDAGPDSANGNSGVDLVRGGSGRDRLFGAAGDDTILGESESDLLLAGDAGADTVVGDTGADVMAGGIGDDSLMGNDGTDTISGGAGHDDIVGDLSQKLAPDLLMGGGGHDVVLADVGTISRPGGTDPATGGPLRTVAAADTSFISPEFLGDAAFGQSGDDLLLGGFGDDALDGGPDTDRAIGGDGLDSVAGGAGTDYLAGDNATFTFTSPPAGVPTLMAPRFAVTLQQDRGDMDTLRGGPGSDHVYGGRGRDTIEGGTGDDRIEGNDGPDIIFGLSSTYDDGITQPSDLAEAADAGLEGDADDILGGSPGSPLTNDVGDAITGNTDTDAIVGDDADLVRTGFVAGLPVRRVTGPRTTFGDDTILGNQGADRIAGQGGADVIKGGPHNDHLEGGPVADLLEGNAGDDVVVGGSSGLIVGEARSGDGGDVAYGGAGADLVVGDHLNGLAIDDAQSVSAVNDGTGDYLSGGVGDDYVAGQVGADFVVGGAGSDRVSGGEGADFLWGDRTLATASSNRLPFGTIGLPPIALRATVGVDLEGAPAADGADTMVGGAFLPGRPDVVDVIDGDGGNDLIAGDNAVAVSISFTEVALDPFDVTGPATTAGNDIVAGGLGNDHVWGQGGNDTISGGDGNDRLYGELGNDTLDGGAGRDGLVGDRGSVALTKAVPAPNVRFASGILPRGELVYRGGQAAGTDLRLDLRRDLRGIDLHSPGLTTGGADTLRGGDDNDLLAGGAGDDLMQGGNGGDVLFGGDGADAMWGGRGRPDGSADPGARGEYVDFLFGGAADSATAPFAGADVMDYRPRPGDPQAWRDIASDQNNQGQDVIVGGRGLTAMQGNLPLTSNVADWLFGWDGSSDLHTYCGPLLNGNQSTRVRSDQAVTFIRELAFRLGLGTTLGEASKSGSTAHDTLALPPTTGILKGTPPAAFSNLQNTGC